MNEIGEATVKLRRAVETSGWRFDRLERAALLGNRKLRFRGLDVPVGSIGVT